MKRTFSQLSRAWYGPASLRQLDKGRYEDVINIQVLNGENLVGEITVEFHRLSGELCARICCFDDGGQALMNCMDMVQEFANQKNWNQISFSKMLMRLGFEDVTKTLENADENSLLHEVTEMISAIHKEIDWEDVPPGQSMTIGLFVDRNMYFVAPMGAGSPEAEDSFIGARLFATEIIHDDDDLSIMREVAHSMLSENEQFLGAFNGESPAPNWEKLRF